jgi:alpha-L-rhamnosidase
VVALSFGLMPPALEETAASRLADDVNKFGHITTGFLGAADICHVLTQYGHLDEAYQLLYRKDYPSWLYPVTRGATTIWERWDGIKPDSTFQNPGMNSFNHYAYGAVGDWLYRKVAGIDLDPAVPGFKSIIIKPHPGSEMNNVSASHDTPHGEVSSDWEIKDGKFTLKVKIPVNTTANVYVPTTGGTVLLGEDGIEGTEPLDVPGVEYDYIEFKVGSGEYTIESPYNL